MPDIRPAVSPAMVRQHLIAAQRLAWGDPLEHAAMQASMTTDALRQREAEPDFQAARDAEEVLLALEPAAWERRMDGLMRQAAERALVDGRISTVNLLLKARLNLTSVTGRPAPRRNRDDEDDQRDDEEDGLDDTDWLASLPVVESDPEREAERRRALMKVEPKSVRRTVGHAPLRSIEQYLVVGDPVAYEEWFARQPKPPRQPCTSLTEADRAAVAHVTRNNPPWIRGEYLSYYRPPVPAHLFLPGAKGDDEAGGIIEGPPAEVLPEPAEAPTTESPVAALRTRVTPLLDRTAVRTPEEFDLAEAICALKWPKWPDYRGAIDPFLLRRALADIRLDDGTVSWLGSHELAKACKAAAVKRAQGP